MLTKVEINTSGGNLLSLPLSDISNGYKIIDIQGLDPVKATLVSSSTANMDGAQYHSSRRETRNIILKVGFKASASTSISYLRTKLYNYFMPKSAINLLFYTSDGLILNISGRIETCESDMFSKEPTTNISIICFDPDFISSVETQINGYTVIGNTNASIMYDGNVETGIIFKLYVNRSVSEFTIYHIPPNGTLRQLDFAASLINNDVLTISTTPGSKSVVLSREGLDTSILFGMSPQSNWIQLEKGLNLIRVYLEGDSLPYTITYNKRYGGL